MSFDRRCIPFAEHEAWYRRIRKDPGTTLWIAKLGDRPIGQVRLTRISPLVREVHIALAASCRGKGLGRLVLERALRQVFAKTRALRVIAHIRPDNTASLTLFRSCGFRFVRTVTVRGARARRYEKCFTGLRPA